MGAYYGVYNQTRKHGVSQYWKGSPPSAEVIRDIAKRYGWDVRSDAIFSGSYCALYKLTVSEQSLHWREPENVHLDLAMDVKTGFAGKKDDLKPRDAIKADEENFCDTYFFN